MHYYLLLLSLLFLLFRIHLILLLVLLIFIIIIIIIIIVIIIYNSILWPIKQKEKGKRLHYLRCGNSSLNHVLFGDNTLRNSSNNLI